MATQPPIQPPLLQSKLPPAFISFTAEINPPTTETLLRATTDFVNRGFREITLLLSTPGGTVEHGIAAYNVLRGLPVSLTTHNVGNVDSIGAVLFLAGEKRFACPEATFMLHGVAAGFATASRLFEKELKERLAMVQRDQERIKAIYCDRAGIKPELAERFFLGEKNIVATAAVEQGIAHAVRPVQIPSGSPVLQLVFNRQGTGHVG